MNGISDYLANRTMAWLAKAGPAQTPVDDILLLQGWSILQQWQRQFSPPPAGHIQQIQSRLSEPDVSLITELINHAAIRVQDLITDLDALQPNFSNVQQDSAETFFAVLDALIIAEQWGASADKSQADELLDELLPIVYIFEPLSELASMFMPDDAARLSSHFCAQVARAGELADQLDAESVDEPVPAFERLETWLSAQFSSATVSLSELSRCLASIPIWNLKWSAQHITLEISPQPAMLVLRINELDAAGQPRPSRAMEGFRVAGSFGGPAQSAIIASSQVRLRLPDLISIAQFNLRIQNPATGQWMELFAKTI